MTKERAGLDIDIPDFPMRPQQPVANPTEVREAAERAGFTARHAPQPAPAVAPAAFDARSLRRSNRTAKLNIATTEEARHRFWMLAQQLGTSSGEEALIAMMTALEAELSRQGR